MPRKEAKAKLAFFACAAVEPDAPGWRPLAHQAAYFKHILTGLNLYVVACALQCDVSTKRHCAAFRGMHAPAASVRVRA